MATYVCPQCNAMRQCPPKMPPLFKRCLNCNVQMKLQRHKVGRSDSQKRSQDQEKRAARRYGMRRQPGSGARDGAKGDLRAPGKRRAELKETIKKSFSLKLDVLMKIEREAAGAEDPLLEIEFQGVFPHKRYVVLPDHAYESMINRLEELDADQADS